MELGLAGIAILGYGSGIRAALPRMEWARCWFGVVRKLSLWQSIGVASAAVLLVLLMRR